MHGLWRNEYFKINKLLEQFPIILILGARQCGKTTLSKQVRPNWKYFDMEKSSDHDFITDNFDLFFREYSENIIIDEAQISPQLFKELRGVIDSNRDKKNRFILTGSSSPELIKHASESLAGRMAIIKLGTFKNNEFYSRSLPEFYNIFHDKLDTSTIKLLKSLKTNHNSNIINSFLYGGYPDPTLNNQNNFYSNWMESYFQSYVERDIKKLFPKLNDIKFRRFIKMLSDLSGTIINHSQLSNSLDVHQNTIKEYLDITNKTFIWRIIPSYESSKVKSLIKMPKGIFRDSGLLNYLSGIISREELYSSPRVGQNFESFIIEEILKGINATDTVNYNYYYYRTRSGSEVDLILEGPFGLLPIEIKFGSMTRIKQLSGLNKFIKDHKLPLGIVINNSEDVRMINDKIIQIPAAII